MDITTIFNKFGTSFLNALPLSPFANAIDNLEIPYLGILNWFFPIGDFIAITSVWLTAITLIYLYSVILRWLKIIGD